MATWIIGIILAVLFAVTARYVFRMFRSGKCVGCSDCKGGCAGGCHHGEKPHEP